MQRFWQTYYFLLLLVGCVFASCEPEPIPEDHIVVEGWIEQGKHPVVILHRSYALDEQSNQTEDINVDEIFAQQMIAFGKVVIDDGEEQVVLTGRLDTNYMPPYIYTSVRMVGEVGKQYTLTATYKDYSATAHSTILTPPQLDSIVVQAVQDDNVRIEAFMSQYPTNEPAYYAFYINEIGQKQFKLCPLGTFSTAQAIDGKIAVIIHSRKGEIGETVTPDNFDKTDSVFNYIVKLARIEYPVYQFLDSYSAQLFSQGMLFMSAYGNIPTNIVGGLGYFSGLGATNYPISIEKDTTYIYSK